MTIEVHPERCFQVIFTLTICNRRRKRRHKEYRAGVHPGGQDTYVPHCGAWVGFLTPASC